MADDWYPTTAKAESWQKAGALMAENTLLSKREATVYLCVSDISLGHKDDRNPNLQEIFEWAADWLSIEPSTVATYWERAHQKEDDARRRKQVAENTIRAFEEPVEYSVELLESE